MTKKIILGLAIVLVLSFCVADIVSANVFIQERHRMQEATGQGCRDTDGGRDAYVKGTTCLGSVCKADECVQLNVPISDGEYLPMVRLIEYYCGRGKVGYGYPQTETAEAILKTAAICPNGCKDGACLRAPTPSYAEGLGIEPICKDLCGDGTCQEVVCLGTGCPCAETAESCPVDCSGAVSCRGENYPCTIDDIPCCSGLKEVGYCFPEGENCICASCGSICRPCGNGVCDANENKCSCPEDCKTTTPPVDVQPIITLIREAINKLNSAIRLLGNLL